MTMGKLFHWLFAGAFLATARVTLAESSGSDWSEYLGGPERAHRSSLDQISRENVNRLRAVWEYHTGDLGEMQCNPLIIDGVLYGVTAANGIFALNAATGQPLWRYEEPGPKSNRTLRGLVYWKDHDERRLLFTLDAALCSLDARTGLLTPDFGTGGKTSLKAGLGERAQEKWVVSTTPGTLFEDLLVMPTRVTEGPDAAPGFVQAFNVRTGKLVWTLHTIPNPGEPGYETWSSGSYQNLNVGGVNCWAGMSIDRARGMIFVPTGSASPDFWGGDRKGKNMFSDSLLALDVRTGRLIWSYQFVHHDLWDRDLPAPPNLVTVKREGKTIDAVAQVTKSGYVFVFDRVTGESLFPIE
jgi:quinoprotein glucose dehydrogenase